MNAVCASLRKRALYTGKHGYSTVNLQLPSAIKINMQKLICQLFVNKLGI